MIANDEVGIAYDKDLNEVWDSLYFIGLSKAEFCKRVFDSEYDKISIAEFFSAKKQKT